MSPQPERPGTSYVVKGKEVTLVGDESTPDMDDSLVIIVVDRVPDDPEGRPPH